MFLNPYRFLSTLGPFDLNGYVTNDLGGWLYVYGSALQPDGKIVITGQVADVSWDNYHIFFARYNSDGTLDQGFGINGIEEKPEIQYSEGGAVAFQTDGKIVFSGDNGDNVIIGRLNQDGSFDTTFMTSGYIIITPDSNPANGQSSWNIISLPDNSILVSYGNFRSNAQPYHHGIVKLTSSGSVDNSFGVNGYVDNIETTTNSFSASNRMALQSDGKILFSVCLDTIVKTYRYTSSGVLDMSFGTSGYITRTSAGGKANPIGIVQQSDGKLILAYSHSQDFMSNTRVTIERLNSNGTSLDNTFGNAGVLTLIGDSAVIMYHCALQSDGKLILSGQTWGSKAYSTRITNTGNVDYTYGDTGTHSFIPPSYTYGYYDANILLYPNGNIILPANGGDNDRDKIYIERLGPSGDAFTNPNKPSASSNTFTLNGYVQTAGWYDPYYDYLQFNDCVEQSDNKIISIGFATLDSTSIMLARHDSNGAMDTSFGDNGIVFISELTSVSPIIESYGNGVTLQTDNKILFCGEYDGDIVVGRLSSSGTLDNSFASIGYASFLTDMNSYKTADQIEVLNDGSILISYHTESSSNSTFIHGIAKISSSGTLDATFTSNATFTDTTYLYNGKTRFVVLPDNKILLTIRKANNTVTLRKLNANGTVDTGFGVSGIVTISPSGTNLTPGDLVVQPDDKIIVLVNSSINKYILRFNYDGSVDSEFASSGMKTILGNVGTVWTGKLNAVNLQYDGKIVIFSSDDEYYGKGTIFRLFTDGLLDFSFGTGGRVDLLPTAPVNITTFYNGLVQADGKIVAVGTSRRGGGGASSIIARFLPNGNLDI